MSLLLTLEEVATKLNVSTKTLRRWEQKGYLVPHKKGGIRLYDGSVVNYWKIMLDLDRKLKEHLKLLAELRDRLKKHNLEQDFVPGKRLKLMTEKDLKSFSEAYEAMEKWNKNYKVLLTSIMTFPRSMLQATIEKY